METQSKAGVGTLQKGFACTKAAGMLHVHSIQLLHSHVQNQERKVVLVSTV